MKKTVLLTGSTGFLGSHLLKELAKNPKYRLIITKRSFSDTWRINSLLSTPITVYDLDKTAIEKIFLENEIDIIINTAVEYGRKPEDFEKLINTNLTFPLKLLKTALNNGTKAFINTDSYFTKASSGYSYLSDYVLSKKSLQIWLEYYSTGIKTVNIIPEHLYGENDNKEKFTEKLIRQIAVEQVESIDLTPGEQERDFIYVTDAVNAYIKIIEFCLSENFQYKTFEVGTGKSVKIRDFAEKIKSLSNSPTNLNFGGLNYRNNEIMRSFADTGELLHLGWKPEVSLEEGLLILFDHNRRIVSAKPE